MGVKLLNDRLFAELIIKECVQVLSEDDSYELLLLKVKEHFEI